jgi:hypothetical protein
VKHNQCEFILFKNVILQNILLMALKDCYLFFEGSNKATKIVALILESNTRSLNGLEILNPQFTTGSPTPKDTNEQCA